jgi:osmotically inducible protein OsmC
MAAVERSRAMTFDGLNPGREQTMITRTATARYEGMGKAGKGWLSTQSGVLKEQPYGFATRFEDAPGTNPEELIAAAHAGCFTMALSFKLAAEGISDGKLETSAKVRLDKEGEGFKVSRSDLELTAAVPGIDEPRLRALAEDAKANCPISKLLSAEMTLDVTIREPAQAE